MQIQTSTRGAVFVVTICRSEKRNAVDRQTAALLHAAFVHFEECHELKVAVLTGENGNFCAGADLSAMVQDKERMNLVSEDMDDMGPMGPTRLALSKPVIAAIEGFAVAGGLELACWCDLRVAARDAVLGVYCRMRGVPLIDGGTVRLPRLIGLSRATDLVLTGRDLRAEEAHEIGLVNYLAPPGQALETAVALANQIAKHPETCMRNDRASMMKAAYSSDKSIRSETGELGKGKDKGRFNAQGGEREALRQEIEYGIKSLKSVEFGGAIRVFLDKSKL
ncbi:Enoyl-CoA hydratase [Podochytrium sp. JEL0797]|nr:Enoyl-CoA hydratase [Podochytrium sp. JEL0797]